jgi:thymidine kinase
MLEVITGAMEAGKTWLLYKKISDAKLMGKNVQVFAFPVHEGHVVSRVGFKSKAITVPTVAEIESLLEPDVDTVAIDDAQLFEAQDLINFCNRYRKKFDIIIAGVQLNSFGENFGAMVELMGRAENVTVLLGVCAKCKQQTAIISQRFRDKEHTIPITKDDPKIELRKEFYAPVCWECYQPPV